MKSLPGMKTTKKQSSKPQKSAFAAALHLLSYRGQSESELRKKLKDRDYTTEEIEKAILKLKHYDYIDDQKLARDVFEGYRARGVYGDSFIHQKMKLRGLFIDEHISREEELRNAKKLLLQKEKIIPGFSGQYRRAAGFLSRRGFTSGTIIRALNEVHDGNEISDPLD